jgi:hypothetical protein
MAKSSKQIETEMLQFLEGVATDQSYDLATRSIVDKYMLESAKAFIDRAKDNIRKKNLIASGDLESQLTFETEVGSDTYILYIGYPAESTAAKYYDYVNKGVRGYTSGSPNSIYSFKSPFPNRKMAASIFSWANRLRIRDKYEAEAIKTKFGKKRARITKMISEAENKKRLAYAISSSIKKKGIKRSLFFDNAKDFAFGRDFVNGLSKIMGKEVSLVIKSATNGNNSK